MARRSIRFSEDGTFKRARKNLTRMSSSRWSKYAAAGAATIVAGHHSADAAIVYVDPEDILLSAPPGSGGTVFTYLDLNSDFLYDFVPWHFQYSGTGTRGTGDGWAGIYNSLSFGVSSLNRVAGFSGPAPGTTYFYASNVPAGVNISTLPNISADGTSFYANLAFVSGTFPGSQFYPPMNTGFLGLSFQDGADTLYGWMRITVNDTPLNTLTIHDWAYNDDGGPILAGQKTDEVFMEADFDRDGDVDGDDFLLWQTGFGTPSGATKMDGDYDNDEDVDGDDFLGWQTEFGSSDEVGSGAVQGVPEPGCLGLLAVGGVGLVAWRRRRANAARERLQESRK